MLCELCGCEEHYDFHHLIPRTLHTNKWFKRNFTLLQRQTGLYLCKECHNFIHDVVPKEKELGRKYNTLETLCAHPKIAAYIAWKRKRFRLDAEDIDP